MCSIFTDYSVTFSRGYSSELLKFLKLQEEFTQTLMHNSESSGATCVGRQEAKYRVTLKVRKEAGTMQKLEGPLEVIH